jgi:hypothetical protein
MWNITNYQGKEITPIVRYYFLYVIMTVRKKRQRTSVGETAEKREPLHYLDKNIN